MGRRLGELRGGDLTIAVGIERGHDGDHPHEALRTSGGAAGKSPRWTAGGWPPLGLATGCARERQQRHQHQAACLEATGRLGALECPGIGREGTHGLRRLQGRGIDARRCRLNVSLASRFRRRAGTVAAARPLTPRPKSLREPIGRGRRHGRERSGCRRRPTGRQSRRCQHPDRSRWPLGRAPARGPCR